MRLRNAHSGRRSRAADASTLLLMGIGRRAVFAAVYAALLWAAVAWALRG